MEREYVRSSNLKSIGYDDNNQILEIEFNHGGVYRYFGVPEDVHYELMTANSKGSYFSSHIKNIYRTQKL
ncbi:KTSC domain-containing protein [Flavobacterium sp. LHD-80]|uniref:KTSC domain-containing protein n=1 Tax=Flavobacterium sp. LHD-80 TaxID=3071411 RepID=UPI0027DFA566|nr:KTSC domain-containing protein [Flavobacterium sp. LHD-80]MDQ6470871.1 KTSC domain-containing protein [Flavobacterium sp. LHD-80]